MKNAIYTICEKLRGHSWNTEYFEVLKAKRYPDDTCEIIARLINEETENQVTQNIIHKICEKLSGYSWATEYFEVLSVRPDKDNEYIIVVKLVNTEEGNKKVTSDDSN